MLLRVLGEFSMLGCIRVAFHCDRLCALTSLWYWSPVVARTHLIVSDDSLNEVLVQDFWSEQSHLLRLLVARFFQQQLSSQQRTTEIWKKFQNRETQNDYFLIRVCLFPWNDFIDFNRNSSGSSERLRHSRMTEQRLTDETEGLKSLWNDFGVKLR